jgi:micrococcal nuclease
MFEYNATVVRVVDGDTLDAMIDLGFDTWKKIRIRMHGINTPESRTRDLEEKKLGLAAKARLIEILEENKNEFILISHGVGKYGRCLGEILLNHYDSENTPTAQELLIKEGHGTIYFGGKR